jgi:hypothetical protein
LTVRREPERARSGDVSSGVLAFCDRFDSCLQQHDDHDPLRDALDRRGDQTQAVQGDAMRMSSIVAVLVAAALGYGGAQWLNGREGEIRRGPDGQPDLSAPAPRLNGKPNLSGLWEAERTPTTEFVRVVGPGLPAIQPDLNDITKHVINVFWDMKPTELPLRPEAVALTEQRQKSGRDWR